MRISYSLSAAFAALLFTATASAQLKAPKQPVRPPRPPPHRRLPRQTRTPRRKTRGNSRPPGGWCCSTGVTGAGPGRHPAPCSALPFRWPRGWMASRRCANPWALLSSAPRQTRPTKPRWKAGRRASTCSVIFLSKFEKKELQEGGDHRARKRRQVARYRLFDSLGRAATDFAAPSCIVPPVCCMPASPAPHPSTGWPVRAGALSV